ncbi:hypothetical protein D9M68_384020 [compost metagenome]
MLKKSAETMLTRLDTMSAMLPVSAMKPAAMTKASEAPGPKPSASSISMTMGVRISAAPSLANSADTAAPSRTISTNRSRPRPPPQRATCSADHSKKPASSRIRLVTMMAMKVAVAFQTMRQTSAMSARWTTPVASASAAPSTALQPMDRPLGCQMTSVMVRMNMAAASSMEEDFRRAGAR